MGTTCTTRHQSDHQWYPIKLKYLRNSWCRRLVYWKCPRTLPFWPSLRTINTHWAHHPNTWTVPAWNTYNNAFINGQHNQSICCTHLCSTCSFFSTSFWRKLWNNTIYTTLYIIEKSTWKSVKECWVSNMQASLPTNACKKNEQIRLCTSPLHSCIIDPCHLGDHIFPCYGWLWR